MPQECYYCNEQYDTPCDASHIKSVTCASSDQICLTQWIISDTDQITDNISILERRCFKPSSNQIGSISLNQEDCGVESLGKRICSKFCDSNNCNGVENDPNNTALQEIATMFNSPIFYGFVVFVAVVVCVLCSYVVCQKSYFCYDDPDYDDDDEESNYAPSNFDAAEKLQLGLNRRTNNHPSSSQNTTTHNSSNNNFGQATLSMMNGNIPSNLYPNSFRKEGIMKNHLQAANQQHNQQHLNSHSNQNNNNHKLNVQNEYSDIGLTNAISSSEQNTLPNSPSNHEIVYTQAFAQQPQISQIGQAQIQQQQQHQPPMQAQPTLTSGPQIQATTNFAAEKEQFLNHEEEDTFLENDLMPADLHKIEQNFNASKSPMLRATSVQSSISNLARHPKPFTTSRAASMHRLTRHNRSTFSPESLEVE